MNQLSFVKQVIYKLKRAYGYPISIYRFKSQSVDVDTGKYNSERLRLDVRKAVILPSALLRKFSYDLSYIAANKNFAYGGHYDVDTRLMIVDGVDLPKNFVLMHEDYIVHDRHYYVLRQVEAITENLGYLITAKETEGTPPFQILDETVVSNLNPVQGGN